MGDLKIETEIVMRKRMEKYASSLKRKTITRTMYCAKCASQLMPKINNVVIVFGKSSQRYRPFSIKKDSKVREYGFTPHLITVDRLQYINNQEVVVFKKKCGMNGCGVDIQFTNTEKSKYRIWDINEEIDWMTLKTFYDLAHYKDYDYYVYEK